MNRVHHIPLSISNAYLIEGAVNILVDTGSPGEGKKIIKILARKGVKLSDLSEFGLNATLHHTPGHSEGSISIALDSGDIIIGDILMCGMMGGAFFPTQPGYHYFIEDREKLHRSIETILQLRGERYWVGHGGPFTYSAIARWYEKVI